MAKENQISKYDITIILILLIAITLLSLFVPGFFSTANLTNVLRQVATLGFLVLGVSLTIICGQIDLSMATIMTNSAIIGVFLIQKTNNVLLAIVAMIILGMAIGVFNGVFVGRFKVAPFIVTLSVMIIGSGFAAWTSRDLEISKLPDIYRYLGTGQLWVIPFQFILFVIIVVILYFLMNRSFFGRWVYSIGINSRASKLCGIPIDLVILLIFIISGLLAALSGIVLSAQIGTASASMGRQGLILDYIIAATLGGISITGGKGKILNTIIGTILVVLLTNSMNLMGVGYYITLMIKGSLIILVVALQKIREN